MKNNLNNQRGKVEKAQAKTMKNVATLVNQTKLGRKRTEAIAKEMQHPTSIESTVIKKEDRTKYVIWTSIVNNMAKGNPSPEFFDANPTMAWDVWAGYAKPKQKVIGRKGNEIKGKQVVISTTATKRALFQAFCTINDISQTDAFDLMLTSAGRKRLASMKGKW
jgi:hypothetical protein